MATATEGEGLVVGTALAQGNHDLSRHWIVVAVDQLVFVPHRLQTANYRSLLSTLATVAGVQLGLETIDQVQF